MRKLLVVAVLLGGLVAFDLAVADDSRLRAGADSFQAGYDSRQAAIAAEEEERLEQARRSREARESGELDWDWLEEGIGDSPVETTVELINESRAAEGLVPLEHHPEATEVARAWSRHMRDDDELYHNPDYGSQLQARIPGVVSWAENVGWNHGSLERRHESFMDSPGHRDNILGDFTHVGVGIALDHDNEIVWVTHNFVTIR